MIDLASHIVETKSGHFKPIGISDSRFATSAEGSPPRAVKFLSRRPGFAEITGLDPLYSGIVEGTGVGFHRVHAESSNGGLS